MPTQNWYISPRAVFVGAGDVDSMTVRNVGEFTVYYSNAQSVSPLLYSGTIPSGSAVTIGAGQWCVTASGSTQCLVSPSTSARGAVGPAGPPGGAGATGQTGLTGPQGVMGPAGASGTGFTWRGNWSSATAYAVADVVFYLGSSFIAITTSTNVIPTDASAQWDSIVIAGPAGPQGPTGAPGAAGNAGPAGPQGASGISDQDGLRGVDGRFYRDVSGAFTYDGTTWVLTNDALIRPQNIDSITVDSAKITVVHAGIAANHVGSVQASVGENLSGVGIYPITRPGLASTDILLRRTRRIDDALQNNGTTWDKEKGLGSPFTATGLTNDSADFPALVTALANLASYYRLSETSGAVLDDATAGSHDGAVVGSGATYGVTGGLGASATDKAITTSGVSPNELTFPVTGTGVTQAAMSVIWRGKLGAGQTVLFRDGTSQTGTGFFVASDGVSSSPFISYRMGTGVTWSTLTPWAALADGDWHTVIVTKNGANVALYMDGVLLHSATNAPSVGLNSPWHCGLNTASGLYQPTTVSEFATVARAITAGEVLSLSDAANADGLLHVTHTDMGSTSSAGISLTQLGVGPRPVLAEGSVTATGFDVIFVDGAGAQVLTQNTAMHVGIVREVSQQVVDPTDVAIDVLVAPQDDWLGAVQATAPIGHWRLGESSGTNFNDEIGTNDGTLQTGVTLGATGAIVGDADKAATFNGAQGKIAFADPNIAGAYSVSIWAKQTGAGSVGGTDAGTLIGWSVGLGPAYWITIYSTTGAVRADTGNGPIISAPGTALLNQWNHVVYTWDLLTQKLIVNGQVVASGTGGAKAGILSSPFWLGSYLGTATGYSFKGDLDELIIWNRAITVNEAQQLYVTGANTAIEVDRSTLARITFRGIFETSVPSGAPTPPQALPDPTPLPAADEGGFVTGNRALTPYRATLNSNGPSAPWVGRALPATQGARDAILVNGISGWPNATSDNWRLNFCAQYGINSTTGAVAANSLGGATPMWMSAGRHYIYVVGPTQPKRAILDEDVSVSGWAATFNAAQAALGGLPVPADALPDWTGDKFCFVFDPSIPAWDVIYSFGAMDAERAVTTLELTGSPSSGGVFLKFTYTDHVNQWPREYVTQALIHYNATAADILDVLSTAETTIGGVQYGLAATSNGLPRVLVSGGPLNAAPVRLEWPFAAPLQGVGMTITDNFLNAGTVHFTYKNSDAWTHSRLSTIVHPSVAGGRTPTNGPATGTGIDQFPMLIDWAEYKVAYDIGIASGWDAAGTDLGHVIGMCVGNAAGPPFSAVYPARRGDGTLSPGTGEVAPQGALGSFPLNADSSRVAPEIMPLFNTIKRYGFISYDKTGGGCEFVCRNWGWPGHVNVAGEMGSFPGPLTFQFGNYLSYMRQLPWHQLQYIDPAVVLSGW